MTPRPGLHDPCIAVALARAAEIARSLGVLEGQVRVDTRGRLLHACGWAPIGFDPGRVFVLGLVLGAVGRERRSFMINLNRYAKLAVVPLDGVLTRRAERARRNWKP